MYGEVEEGSDEEGRRAFTVSRMMLRAHVDYERGAAQSGVRPRRRDTVGVEH